MHPVTQEGQLLAQISGQLDELIGILRPEPTPTEPTPEPGATPVEKPEPSKAPAKKTAQRRRTKVDGR